MWTSVVGRFSYKISPMGKLQNFSKFSISCGCGKDFLCISLSFAICPLYLIVFVFCIRAYLATLSLSHFNWFNEQSKSIYKLSHLRFSLRISPRQGWMEEILGEMTQKAFGKISALVSKQFLRIQIVQNSFCDCNSGFSKNISMPQPEPSWPSQYEERDRFTRYPAD